MRNEVGIESVSEDLNGDYGKTLSTSPSVTGLKAIYVEPVCVPEKLAGFTIDSIRNLSLSLSLSL